MIVVKERDGEPNRLMSQLSRSLLQKSSSNSAVSRLQNVASAAEVWFIPDPFLFHPPGPRCPSVTGSPQDPRPLARLADSRTGMSRCLQRKGSSWTKFL